MLAHSPLLLWESLTNMMDLSLLHEIHLQTSQLDPRSHNWLTFCNFWRPNKVLHCKLFKFRNWAGWGVLTTFFGMEGLLLCDINSHKLAKYCCQTQEARTYNNTEWPFSSRLTYWNALLDLQIVCVTYGLYYIQYF